jgi:hypothetical protein
MVIELFSLYSFACSIQRNQILFEFHPNPYVVGTKSGAHRLYL